MPSGLQRQKDAFLTHDLRILELLPHPFIYLFIYLCSRIPQVHLLFCKIYFVNSLGGCPRRDQLLHTDNRNLWYLRDIVLCQVLQRAVERISRPWLSLECWFWDCSLGTLVFLIMQVTMRGQHASLALCVCVCVCMCVLTCIHMHTHEHSCSPMRPAVWRQWNCDIHALGFNTRQKGHGLNVTARACDKGT